MHDLMADYANVIVSSNGEDHIWSGAMRHLPRVGDSFSCRYDLGGSEIFSGIVKEVHFAQRVDKESNNSINGQVITVWVEPHNKEASGK